MPHVDDLRLLLVHRQPARTRRLLARVAAPFRARSTASTAAMTRSMTSAERIGRGQHSEPVPPSGVREIAALEASLERMRQALARHRRSRATTSTRCSTA